MKIDAGAIQQGVTTAVSPSYMQLLASDFGTSEPCYTARSNDFVNASPIKRSLYFSREFAAHTDHVLPFARSTHTLTPRSPNHPIWNGKFINQRTE